MIHEKALTLAGPAACLVARPRGVLHVYTGPITACAHVPRARRPLCRARTRQLTVTRAVSSLDPSPGTPRRLCARCSAAILRDGNAAEQHPTTRREYATAYAGTTHRDLRFALQLAETPAEVDAAAHLTLVVFGISGSAIAAPDTGRSLTDEVAAARTRVHGWPESVYADAERFDLLVENATQTRKARAKAARQEKDRAWEASRPQITNRSDNPEGATA